METPQIKFNKSFETLYNSAMALADQCIVAKAMEKRFEKLDEEFKELIDAFQHFQKTQDNPSRNLIKGECGDLLFVLLHIAHISGWTAFDLLHGAMSKMLARMNDASYIAKN